MCLFGYKLVLLLLIEVLFNLFGDGSFGGSKTAVSASGNAQITGPFLQIEKRQFAKLSITKPHLEHFVDCKANIDAAFYKKNKPNLFYTWHRNGNVLQTNCGRRNDFCVFDNGTIRLPPTEKAGGLYRCQVNANTIAVLSESVTVEYPVLKRMPALADLTATLGVSFTFNCPIQSLPAANISWYHDNVSLSSAATENRYIFLGNGSMVLLSPTVSDEGKYRCFAQNQFSTKTHRQFIWTLKVNDSVLAAIKTTQNYGKLVPQLQEGTLYVPVGLDLKLRCHSISDQVPIEWWFQRVPSAPVEKLSNFSNEYEIKRASVNEHDGYYTCSSAQDKQMFHVIVTIPPTIVKQLPSYESHIAALVTLSCHALGNPTPEISWYHNAEPVNSTFLRYITTNELRLISFDSYEEGIYQCFARNAAGEASTDGEIRLRSLNPAGKLIPNPLKNIRCYPHSSTTINITFDRVILPMYFLSVHIVQSHPHRWTAIAPLEPIDSSYVVISSHLPAYRPFELITRVMLHTSNSHSANHSPIEEPVISSLRSLPITCCTQGLPLQIIKLRENATFVTWPQPELKAKKYYILQFDKNHTRPNPQTLLRQQLRGTTAPVLLKEDDVTRKLGEITALNRTEARAVLRRVDKQFVGSIDNAEDDIDNEDIFNLVLPAKVTGIILEKLKLLKMRILIITGENEYLRQDFRYVQWKVIENETNDSSGVPFHLTKVESRMVAFLFRDPFKDQCVYVCYTQINNQEESMCIEQKIANSQLEVRSLKPTSWYRLNFSSCRTKIFYGQKDFQTLADPPGTISNQRVTRQNGLKLSWDPPVHPNGKIHHYNILWTINNVTHEANVFECGVCFYKFPHISETAKINITVRVVGENGIGAPIFIDLRNINHQTLEVEHTSNSEVYSGIAIGAVLSACCVFFFSVLIACQRRRYKSRQQANDINRPSGTNFDNLSSGARPCNSAGAISGSTLQLEYHEMQTLIPRSHSNLPFINERQSPLQVLETTVAQKLSNGNTPCSQQHNIQGQRESPTLRGTGVAFVSYGNPGTQVPVFNSTPRTVGKLKEATLALKSGTKPYFIPFRQLSQSAGSTLQKHRSSPNFQSGTSYTLPLGSPPNLTNGHRMESLITNITSTTNNCSTHKHFHTNFQRRSNSNDGICLLAEEESSATLTPTSDGETLTTHIELSLGSNAWVPDAPKSSSQRACPQSENVQALSAGANNATVKSNNHPSSRIGVDDQRQLPPSSANTSTVPFAVSVSAPVQSRDVMVSAEDWTTPAASATHHRLSHADSKG